MPKQSPFFKFDAAEWLSGSIQFATLEQKGLFIDLCAMYWNTWEPVEINTKFKVRYRYDEPTLTDLMRTLTDLDLICEVEGKYTVPFLDKLINDRRDWSEKCSEWGKKSASVKGRSTKKKEERRKKIVDSRKKKVEKEKTTYAQFVHMTDIEYSKVLEKFGSESAAMQAIEKLNNYKGSSGKKYKSDYHAIISWVYEDVKKQIAPFPNAPKPTDINYDDLDEESIAWLEATEIQTRGDDQ